MSRSRYIAFDPAVRTGWAWQNASGEWRTGTIDPRDHDALVAVIEEAKADGVECAAVEDAFLTPGMRRNVRTLKALMGAQMRVRIALELCDMPCELVMPNEWRSGWGIRGDRRACKAAAMDVARRLGADVRVDDEADAVLLAEFAQSRARQEELV